MKVEQAYSPGDNVKDVNPSCPHFGAEGKVKSVNPRSVVFIVKNKGDNFKPGQELEKSHDQMKKMKESKIQEQTVTPINKIKDIKNLVKKDLVSYRGTGFGGNFEISIRNKKVPGYPPSFALLKKDEKKYQDIRGKQFKIKPVVKYFINGNDLNQLKKFGHVGFLAKNKTESVNEADTRNDKSIGTKNYKGVGWFWPSALWKHYLRDTSDKGRKVVHDLWLKAGFEVVTDKRGVPHFNIKPSQKNKAMSIVDKVEKKMPVNEALSSKAKPLAKGLTKKQKDSLEMMIDMQGLDQVLSDYKNDKKAFVQAIKDMNENINEKKKMFPPLKMTPKQAKEYKKFIGYAKMGVEYQIDMSLFESVNEDGHTDVASAKTNVMLMVEDSNKLLNKLNGMNKEDSLPSWLSDKITLSQNYLSKATDYLTNPVESINENRDFEKLYNLFTKKDYFNLKNSIKTMLRNYDVALKKGDKGAQKYTKQDVIKSVTAHNKENAKRVYDELLTAIKKKDIRRLKSRLRHNQPYSIAIFNQITGKKLPKTSRDIHSFLDNEFMKESVNEARLDPKQLLQQLGGNKFVAMTGAKNLATDKSKNELHMKIMRNAKGISHVIIRLTSGDLYDMEFLSIRGSSRKIKSKEKGVYADQLGKMFKKNTGLDVRL